MPLIHEDYGYYTYTRVAKKAYRCNHWKHIALWEGMECGAAILPGDAYVESVCAPYSDSPHYKRIMDERMPWIEKGRKLTWGRTRLCLTCAGKELRSFPQVRALVEDSAYA
jgi:hypothetical protein